MINPAGFVDAVRDAFRSIPELLAAMGNDPRRIASFHYTAPEQQLSNAVYSMLTPSILLAWDGTRGGNYDGTTINKIRIGMYIRAGNISPYSYEYVWYVAMNRPVLSTGLNIRQVQIIPEVDIMDTPSVSHHIDEMKVDYFSAVLEFPEIGDSL